MIAVWRRCHAPQRARFVRTIFLQTAWRTNRNLTELLPCCGRYALMLHSKRLLLKICKLSSMFRWKHAERKVPINGIPGCGSKANFCSHRWNSFHGQRFGENCWQNVRSAYSVLCIFENSNSPVELKLLKLRLYPTNVIKIEMHTYHASGRIALAAPNDFRETKAARKWPGYFGSTIWRYVSWLAQLATVFKRILLYRKTMIDTEKSVEWITF